MSVWQQAVIDLADAGHAEAAVCANAEGFVLHRHPHITPGTERFYELVYRRAMAEWSKRT